MAGEHQFPRLLDEWWKAQARCAPDGPQPTPTDDFFPPKGTNKVEVERIQRICAICPVKLACLEYAMERNIAFGIWGGHTVRDRQRLRLARRRAS